MDRDMCDCPLCEGQMPADLVVCWPCFRSTERLSAVPAEDHARWAREREERSARAERATGIG